jgi:hypothetical protein
VNPNLSGNYLSNFRAAGTPPLDRTADGMKETRLPLEHGRILAVANMQNRVLGSFRGRQDIETWAFHLGIL